MKKISPNEKEIIGNWKIVGTTVVADLNCKRIELLTENYLKKIAEDESGWISLYQDPADERYWELSYRSSEFQGGGIPNLKNISAVRAKKL